MVVKRDDFFTMCDEAPHIDVLPLLKPSSLFEAVCAASEGFTSRAQSKDMSSLCMFRLSGKFTQGITRVVRLLKRKMKLKLMRTDSQEACEAAILGVIAPSISRRGRDQFFIR